MRLNLTIVTVAFLLLFLKRTCLANRENDHYNARILHERGNYGLDGGFTNADPKMNNVRTAKDNGADEQKHGTNRAFDSTNPVSDEDTLSVAESGNVYSPSVPSATGISVKNGLAVGYGRAYVGDTGNAGGEAIGMGLGERRLVGGRAGGSGNIEYVEEYGSKYGKDIAIARAGGARRSGEGTMHAGTGYSGVDVPLYKGVIRSGAGYPGINSAADERAMRSGAGYPNVNSADDEKATRPGAGYPNVNSAADERATRTGAGYPNINSVADGRGVYDRGTGNGRGPNLRPETGVRLDNGNGRRVTEDGYHILDLTGTGIQGVKTDVGKDGSVVHRYKTDGRPTRVYFRDRNGGVGVFDHFYDTTPIKGGLNGNAKGTSVRSGFSLAYGRGIGNDGSVAYGSSFNNGGGKVVLGTGFGNSRGVAYGNGVRDGAGVAYGNGFGDAEAVAFGTGVRQREPVAYSSSSGIVSGTNIKLGYGYVGSRKNTPNNGAHRGGEGEFRQGEAVAYSSGDMVSGSNIKVGDAYNGSRTNIPNNGADRVGISIGRGVGQGETVAYASGSGIISGSDIKVADTYVGPRKNTPNSGARRVGISIGEGTFAGNSRAFLRGF